MRASKTDRALAAIRALPVFRGPQGVVYINGATIGIPSSAFTGVAIAAFVKAHPGETISHASIQQAIAALAHDDTIDETDKVPPPRPIRSVEPNEDTRPEIELVPDVHETTQKMIAALGADDDLYQRGGSLAHVIRSAGSPLVRLAPLSWMIDRVSKHARCTKRTTNPNTNETYVRHVAPPPDSVRAVLEHGSWDLVRELCGIAEAPFLRPNGTILQSPGYDDSTRYLYVPNAEFPPVPDKPTKQDAAGALKALAEPFDDFPYVDASHRFAVIAALMTLLARPAIRGSVPCWLFDASAARSGKSLQVDVIHIIATGRPASRMTYPEQDDELEKVLAGYALNGAATVNFDNVARKFGGAALDKVITSADSVDLRVLGSTGVHTYPWKALVFASGNNVECRGDMLARVLAPRLESPLENPEAREGLKHPNLRAWAASHRARLVVAALTVLRAYAVAGAPTVGCAKWGGFEAWSRMIPHAIVWAGGTDPMGARRGLGGDEDPIRVAEAALVSGWALLQGGTEGLAVSAALSQLYPDRTTDAERSLDGHDGLREALEELTGARPGSHPNARQVGNALRRVKHRPFGGVKLTSVSFTHGVTRWRVIGDRSTHTTTLDDTFQGGEGGH